MYENHVCEEPVEVRTGVTDSYDWPHRSHETNLGSLEEQQVIFITDSSLQPFKWSFEPEEVNRRSPTSKNSILRDS